MSKNIATVPAVTSLQATDTLLAEVAGSVKRIAVKDLDKVVASNVIEQTFTLELSTSSKFDVNDSVAVENYIAHMGGYMFRVSGGKVYAAKLNPNDWTHFTDGTAVDDPTKYETMVHLPPCNFKASGQTMQFGGLTPISGGHTFASPEWVGAYQMYVDSSGAGHSRQGVGSSRTKAVSAFWDAAQKLGTQWGLANYQFHCLINALYQAKFGDLNSQDVIGAGFQSSSWEGCRDVPSGQCLALGDGSGSVTYTDDTLGTQHPVKLFGIEDLWGKLWEFRPGIRFTYDSTTALRTATVYDGNQVSNTATGRTFTIALMNASGAYTTKMVLSEWWDMIPKAVGGGSPLLYSDGYWDNNSGQQLRVGGAAGNGARCGLSCAASDADLSVAVSNLGARLAFYGVPAIVSGSELVSLA